MRRSHVLAVALALACAAATLAHAADKIEAPTRSTSFDWQCQDANGQKLSDHTRFDTAFVACYNNAAGDRIQGGTYKLPARGTTPPPPTCPAAPTSTKRPQDCPTGTTGSWEQTSTSTVGPAPACAVSTTWSPSSPPAGACAATCPPKPADETKQGTCPAGSSGSWTQTQTYTSAAAPTCWVPSGFLPAEPPPTACNRPPTIIGIAVAAVVAGQAYSFTPTASDPDGDALTFSIANKPTWAAFSVSTGALTGTPAAANVGITSGIKVTASDGKESTSTAAFTITVTAPPVLGAPTNLAAAVVANTTNPANSNVKLTWDAVPGATGYEAWRCTGASCTTFVFLADTTTATYTNTNLPPGITFRYKTRAWKPDPAGAFSSIVPATTLPAAPPPPPTNRAPTIAGTPATSVVSGQAYAFQPTGADADGDALSYAIQNKPAWASFTPTDGRVFGTTSLADAGTYPNIQVSVTDGKETAALATFSITVTAQPTGSAPLRWTPPTTNTDGSTLSNLAGYRIYYGPSPGVLSKAIAVNNPGISAYVVDGLVPGTWYFAVTAVTTPGAESAQSNVVDKIVP